MKKVCTFLIALLLILSSLAFGTEQSEAASFRTVKVVTGSSLVVKASASPSAKTVATLSKGNFVTVFSTSNGWANIQSGNVRGHVNASFLKTPSSTIKIASSKSGLVVKATPSKSTPTSATLKHNMIVEDFGSVGGGWSFVQYGNVTGYVASSFIGKPKTSTKYVNTASGVVVRNIASPSGASIGTLTNSTQVTVHSTIAGWSYVTTGSTKGYVVNAFLSTIKPQVTGGIMPKNELGTLFPIRTSLDKLTSYYGDPTYDDYYMGGRLVMFNDEDGYILDDLEMVTGFMVTNENVNVFGTHVGMVPSEISSIFSETPESYFDEHETQSYINTYYKYNYEIFYSSEKKNGITTSVIIMRK